MIQHYQSHPLAQGCPPAWASAWGQDEYGVWTAFTVAGVTQRLRWIAPGRFLMGSPETEEGRFDREGPLHEVVLSHGFWLFDTPCTQALWLAVMGGENPSYFQSLQRPVEQVSWHDTQQFINALNKQIPGLLLRLPTEAQWEYACRAGTSTATYAGDLTILGERNAPMLHEIAWYGGNSGKDYELDKGWVSSAWDGTQFKNSKSGSREVGLKRANAWGLYDMLGNVWEWCRDGRRNYREETERDPIGPDGGSRVIRGGAWFNDARYVRAAYRGADSPGVRRYYLGFRCALVHREPGRPVPEHGHP